jgi:hypothetical protein
VRTKSKFDFKITHRIDKLAQKFIRFETFLFYFLFLESTTTTANPKWSQERWRKGKSENFTAPKDNSRIPTIGAPKSPSTRPPITHSAHFQRIQSTVVINHWPAWRC